MTPKNTGRVSRRAAAINVDDDDENEAAQGIADRAHDDDRTASNDKPAEIEDVAPLKTRRSRIGGGNDDWEIPAEYKNRAYDYEWKTTRVNGQDSDAADFAFYNDQGWEPVPARVMPKMLPPGSDKKYIERRGQILMFRPMTLSIESRREDLAIAEQQKRDKVRQATDVPVMGQGRVVATQPEVALEGVVGTHKAPARQAAS